MEGYRASGLRGSGKGRPNLKPSSCHAQACLLRRKLHQATQLHSQPWVVTLLEGLPNQRLKGPVILVPDMAPRNSQGRI